jgi:hypothetical protein
MERKSLLIVAHFAFQRPRIPLEKEISTKQSMCMSIPDNRPEMHSGPTKMQKDSFLETLIVSFYQSSFFLA